MIPNRIWERMLYYGTNSGFTYAKLVHGPQLNTDDWSGFETGTIECLGSIQGSGGVPLSYMLKDDVLRPPITIASP